MPIQAQPDPNNPGQFRWVDSDTGRVVPNPSNPNEGRPQNAYGTAGEPATSPTTTPTPAATTPTTPPPTSTAPPATPAQSAQGSAASAAQTPPAIGAPSGQLGPGQQGPAPVVGQGGYTGMYTPDQGTAQAAAAVQQANLNVAAAYQAIQDQQQKVDAARALSIGEDPNGVKMQAAQSGLNAAYAQLSQAEDSLSTANTTYATSLNKFTDPQALAQAKQATAAAQEADARRALLTDDTPGGQRALNAAQAGAASAKAAADQASADAIRAKTPDEQRTLQAQADLYHQQASQISAQIGTPDNPGPLIRKANEEVNTQIATTGQVQSQTELNKATATRQNADANLSNAQADAQRALIAAGYPAAQTAQAQGAAAQSQATAAQTLEDIQAKKLGPAYGLDDKMKAAVAAIQNHIFGPGGTGNVQDANDLLGQFLTATLGGTNVFEASKAAAGQESINYGTQMAGVNALQAAQANRAGTLGSLTGNTLGTLAGMNAYAPKGSDAMAQAFAGVMGAMANKLTGPQFGPVQIPNPPPLPGFLAGFAAGHQAGSGQAAAQGAGTGGGQAAPTVNINVNGQPSGGPGVGATFNPQASTAAMNAAGFMDTPQGRAAMVGGTGAGPTPAPVAPAAPAGPASPNPYASYSSPPPINQDVPSFLGQYGLNLPNPMAVLGGRPYVGMGV